VFYGGCRRVSRVLNLSLESISKSTIHDLARRVSMVRVAVEPRYKRCIAVDDIVSK
jgi:phosphoribosylpyrophosphate synthetase